VGQTATIVITDLVGSTALRADLGEEAADRLRSEHDARLTAVAESHGGTVIKGTGDGLIVANRGRRATRAYALQQAICSLGRRSQLPLAGRVRVSAGDVTFEGGDCFGSPVIEAARLCAAADGEQINVNLVRLLAQARGPRLRLLLGDGPQGLPDPVVVHALGGSRQSPGPSTPEGPPPSVGTWMGLLAVRSAGHQDQALALVASEPGIGKTARRRVLPHRSTATVPWCWSAVATTVTWWPTHSSSPVAWARRLDDELRERLGPEAGRRPPGSTALDPAHVGGRFQCPEAGTARLRDSLSQVVRLAAERR
jgi:hypothetical protein